MQKKTIEKVIKAKMEKWLETITDENLRKDVRDNLLVSGGSIASMLMNVPVNDFDVYLMDMDICKRIAKYYIKPFNEIILFDGRQKDALANEYCDCDVDSLRYVNNSRGISLRNLKDDQIKLYFSGAQGSMRVNEDVPKEELNFTPLFFSPNAISLSNDLQVVLRFWGDAERIHETFDFIHATNYFTFKDGLVLNLAAVESILTKQLKYQAVTSIIRAKKFVKRGFDIGAGEFLKMAFQVSQLDLTNPDVLEEQIIGIDVSYFSKVIDALRTEYESDPNFKCSSEYLNVLIDKIFNESEDADEQPVTE